MTKKQWRRKFHKCKYKYYDAQKDQWDKKKQSVVQTGNPLCDAYWPIGRRCMFKICPERIKK